jgi:OPA family sugar phosphate sensor protein UhpC-like MFS transporter
MTNPSPRKLSFLLATWSAYVAFYLCRRNLSIILPIFARDHLYTTSQGARLIFFFSVAYCAGQFVVGGLADRFGGRSVVLCGMTLSAAVTLAMGFSSHYWQLLLCQTINGAAQASGWVGLMKMMKQYPSRKNGVAMGWWSTNYVIGGFFAALLASYALGSSWMERAGWRRAAWVPAVALLLYALVFFVATRKLANHAAYDRSSNMVRYLAVLGEALSSARIRVLIGSYFFVKLIRYSLLFWLPLYLTAHLRMQPVHAGYFSSRLEGYGIIGVVGAGYLSDYVFQSRRFPVALLMMIALSATCIVASRLGSTGSVWPIALVVALLGCATYGADTILVGAAAQDVSRLEHMGTIAGIVDGAGSLGQILSPLLIASVSQRFGWPVVFQCLSAVAMACALLLATGLKLEHGRSL